MLSGGSQAAVEGYHLLRFQSEKRVRLAVIIGELDENGSLIACRQVFHYRSHLAAGQAVFRDVFE
jgi:hypothetical protein